MHVDHAHQSAPTPRMTQARADLPASTRRHVRTLHLWTAATQCDAGMAAEEGVDAPHDMASSWLCLARTGRLCDCGWACGRARTGVRSGSGSGRPAQSPTPRSPTVARCDTRATAAGLATVR